MRFYDIISNLKFMGIKNYKEMEIESLSCNTNEENKNGIYFCLKGMNVDGHKFAKTAIEKQGEIYAPTLAITSAYSSAIGAGGLGAATLDSIKINENKKEKLLNKIMSAVLPLGFASIGGAVSVLNPNDYELVSKGLATTSGGLVSGLTMKSNFDDKKSKDLPS